MDDETPMMIFGSPKTMSNLLRRNALAKVE
jgi:hypothetical protein